MSRVEKLGLAAAGAEPEIVPAERGAEGLRWRGWVASAVLATALTLLLVAAGLRLVQRLEQIESAATARGEALAAQLAELSRANESLRQEVISLRGAVAAGTAEDVLFLKTIILKPNIDLELARTVSRLVRKYAMLFEKDPNLVLALISVESDFNPSAVSKVGAVGLMQVMPHWKKVLNIDSDLSDPETSIRTGLQVLGFYEQMYKDPETVLTAYNRGPGPVDQALMRGASPENGYAAKVLAAYERIRRLATHATMK